MFNFQWLVLRLVALLTFFGLLVDLEIIVLVSGFLLLHINMGLKTIIYDYIHIKKIKIISLSLSRIFIVEMARYILELLI